MLKQRVITAIVALAVLLLALFVLPSAVTRLLIAALFVVAAWEWAGFLSPQGKVARLSYVFVVGIVGAALWFLGDANTFGRVMQVAVIWWILALIWLFFYPTVMPQPLAWLVGGLVIVPAWMALDNLYVEQPLILLFVLSVVWAADIGAFFAGKRFGRVKLAPKVSPGKSWEGVIGGMLAVSILAFVVSRAAGFDLGVVLPLCLAVAVISIVGDLTVSVFKRNAGVKDSGSLFPGHGGVLDRIDSVTAAAPIFVVGWSWIGLR